MGPGQVLRLTDDHSQDPPHMCVQLRGSEGRCSRAPGVLLAQLLSPPPAHPFSLVHSQASLPTHLSKSEAWQQMNVNVPSHSSS